MSRTTWAGSGNSFPFPGGRPLPEYTRRWLEQVGVGVELADELQPPGMGRGQLGQLVRRVIAVGGADERSVGEPADQDAEHLRQQIHRRLVRPLGNPVGRLVLGSIQGRHQRQGPAPAAEGEADQHGQDDPLVPPTIGRERVSGADRVAVTALAVDLWLRDVR